MAAKKKKKKNSYDSMQQLLRILVRVLVIVFAIYLGIFCYRYAYDVFADQPLVTNESSGKDVTVRVDSDMSISDIGKMLEDNGLINDWTVFWGQAQLTSFSKKIQPGTYSLNTSMTAEEMIKAMAAALEDTEEEE